MYYFNLYNGNNYIILFFIISHILTILPKHKLICKSRFTPWGAVEEEKGKRQWGRGGGLVWVESPESNNARLVGGLGRFRDFCTDFSVSRVYSMAQRP